MRRMRRLIIGRDIDGLGLQRRGSSLKITSFWEVALEPFFILVNKGYFVIKILKNFQPTPLQKPSFANFFKRRNNVSLKNHAIFVEDLFHGGKGGLI